jgi:Raf kinase inhibitor-like YbhB/YbcL family protein
MAVVERVSNPFRSNIYPQAVPLSLWRIALGRNPMKQRLHRLVCSLLFMVLLSLAGCGPEQNAPAGGDDSAPVEEQPVTGKIQVTSKAFNQGTAIPKQHTGDGADVSPPLSLANVPPSAASLAIICDDPDAPSRAKPRPEGPWVHWVIFNLPGDVREIAEGVPADPQPPELGARQGSNSWPNNNVGYRGPAPPPGSGPHRYFFKVYALDTVLDLPAGMTDKAALLKAMEGHILDQGELMGTYERK